MREQFGLGNVEDQSARFDAPSTQRVLHLCNHLGVFALLMVQTPSEAAVSTWAGLAILVVDLSLNATEVLSFAVTGRNLIRAARLGVAGDQLRTDHIDLSLHRTGENDFGQLIKHYWRNADEFVYVPGELEQTD